MNWRIILFFIFSIILSIGYPLSIVMQYNVFFGVLIIVYFVLQIVFASMNVDSMKKRVMTDRPSVSIMIIGYRENKSYWADCIRSIIASDYDHIMAIEAFIDGDEEEDQYMKSIFNDIVAETEESRKYSCHITMCEHGGKRHAMEKGFKQILRKYPDNEYIIVADSDTVFEKDAIFQLIRCIHQDPQNGCATGNIKIFNKDRWLARIINARYAYAFNIERGAMSAMGVMNCCSGPFSIYRQSCVDDDLLEDFVNQTYCRKRVGPGDDRHLTLLIMNRGFLSRQTPYAIASTETPDHLHRYFQQQLRWMRSFYREQIWQVRAIAHQNIYLMIITVYEIFFPFFIIISFLPTFNIIDYSRPVLLFYTRLIVAVGIMLLRTFLLLCFNGFLLENVWNICVFPLYFIFLLPIKLYALCTCHVQGWITTTRKDSIMSKISPDIVFIYIFILLWNMFLTYMICKLYLR